MNGYLVQVPDYGSRIAICLRNIEDDKRYRSLTYMSTWDWATKLAVL